MSWMLEVDIFLVSLIRRISGRVGREIGGELLGLMLAASREVKIV